MEVIVIIERQNRCDLFNEALVGKVSSEVFVIRTTITTIT